MAEQYVENKTYRGVLKKENNQQKFGVMQSNMKH